MQPADDDTWPKTSDGTTDWDLVFDDPKSGLIPLIKKAHSPEVLKGCAVVVIEKLFTRKDDGPTVREFLHELNDIVPDDGAEDEFEAMRGGVIALMNRIREERKAKAAVYRAEQVTEAAGPDAATRRSRKRRRRAEEKEERRAAKRIRIVVAVLIAAAAIGVGSITLIPDPPPKLTAQNGAAMQWVRQYFADNPPDEMWQFVSVELSADTVIKTSFRVAEADSIKRIKTISAMGRLSLLNILCPKPDSGVATAITANGLSLWISILGAGETLTGGSCHY